MCGFAFEYVAGWNVSDYHESAAHCMSRAGFLLQVVPFGVDCWESIHSHPTGIVSHL